MLGLKLPISVSDPAPQVFVQLVRARIIPGHLSLNAEVVASRGNQRSGHEGCQNRHHEMLADEVESVVHSRRC